MSTLADRVAHLRALAILEPDVSALLVAIVDMLEQLAEAVDRLESEHPPPPEQHFGTI